MKRLLLIAGLLPLLAPLTADALSPLCEQVVALKPVSPYVQKVLDRSEAGLTYAKNVQEANNGGNFLELSPAARTVADYFRKLVDVRQTLTEQSRDLAENTACKHTDILILQCQMEKVRDEIMTAFKTAKPARLELLQAQLPFLRERIDYVNRGAEDPSFADPTWGLMSPIDPPKREGAGGDYWCCGGAGESCSQSAACVPGNVYYTLDGCLRASQCKAPVGVSAEDSRVCPFSSDYGPALKNGYGCDASVMDSRATYSSMIYERDTLKFINDEINRVSRDLGGTQSLPAEHKVENGCKRKYGYCSENRSAACSEDVDCIEANAGTCMFDLPPAMAWNAVRSPFGLLKDQLGLLGKFLILRGREGYSRLPSVELKKGNELLPGQTQQSGQDEPNGAGMLGAFRDTFRADFSGWSLTQGREDVNPFIQSTDAQQTMAAAFPFTGLSKDLKNVVTSMNGVRGFLLQYAYFARRTCLNRPCSMKLEQVMRIASTNACFPFADGSYRNDTKDNPQWKKCAEEACVPLEGVTIDASKCTCYKINQGANLQYDVSAVSPSSQPDVCVPN